MSKSETPEIPYRQIRALHDDETITVYQAYSAPIAEAAVREQRLYASSDFLFTRMTWIKPSWCWMMYRSAYSTKDDRQARILALKMTHENFQSLLSMASVTHGESLTSEERHKPVRVQWDPERGPRLGEKPYRSIQIGIGREVSRRWAEEWIESIEDVTEMALRLKGLVDGEGKGKGWSVQELVEAGAMPVERVYEVSPELKGVLKMDE